MTLITLTFEKKTQIKTIWTLQFLNGELLIIWHAMKYTNNTYMDSQFLDFVMI